jgi:hypothetical protein
MQIITRVWGDVGGRGICLSILRDCEKFANRLYEKLPPVLHRWKMGQPRDFPVINPATEEPIATISLRSRADVDRVVAAAKLAFESFSEAIAGAPTVKRVTSGTWRQVSSHHPRRRRSRCGCHGTSANVFSEHRTVLQRSHSHAGSTVKVLRMTRRTACLAL